MSPENARVFVVEDDEFYRDRIQEVLREKGHQVILTADDWNKAIDLIRAGRLKDLEIQVATIDGKLSSAGWGNSEGELIAELIKRNLPSVKTIGVSNSGDLSGVDTNVNKTDLDQLGKVIAEL